jgi:hypothetical protein
MKRVSQLLAVVLIVAVAFVAMRYALHQRARSLALAVVAELGARVGSITAPLGGTEYCISFPERALTRADLDRLVILNELAKWSSVRLFLNDATISGEDRDYLKQKLPKVHVSLVEGGLGL